MATGIEPLDEHILANLRELFENMDLRIDDDSEVGKLINFDAVEVEITFPSTADTEQEITAQLERIPERYEIVRAFTKGQVYDGDTTNSEDKLYLKCTEPDGHFILRIY